MRQRIEAIGRTFVAGYHAALETGSAEGLGARLDQVELELRGFAYEGGAMALALLDRLAPWRRDRVRRFIADASEPHIYMAHVGIGWAAARLPGRLEGVMEPLDPLLRWLVLDGYGFHEGFFHWPRCIRGQPYPKRVTGYARRAFDQGLGRSLWFVEGGEPLRIKETISQFPEARRCDLWSGAGLASTYAGQVCESELRCLKEASAPYQPQLAQGSAFAAKARVRAGNVSPYTESACRVLCGVSANEAALATDAALENLPANQAEPAFEVWRRRIQHRFAQQQELKQ
jgi:hypothetical protein